VPGIEVLAFYLFFLYLKIVECGFWFEWGFLA
jgi:hypothetical protein